MSELNELDFKFKEWIIVNPSEGQDNPNDSISGESSRVKKDESTVNQLSTSILHTATDPLNFFNHKFYLDQLTPKQVQEISLVLASQNIDHWTFVHKNNWMFFIDESWVITVEALLKTYVKENHKTKHVLPNLELKLSPFIILIVPILFYFWSMADIFNPWGIRQAGKAIADQILEGQWWRTITALTLHANTKHVMSNFISGYFILNLLFTRRNPIKSSTVVLIAAIAANFLVALTRQENFASLGFSTYVFAGLGSLALVEAVESFKDDIQLSYWRKLQPLYSAFLIALMLGIGENSDILAHFYGFFMGIAISAIFLRKDASKLFLKFQYFVLVGVYLVFAIAWDFAYFRVIN